MRSFANTPTVVDDYIATLTPAQQRAIQRVYDIARQIVPDAQQAVYYNMPCLKYKDKGLVSVMVTKKFISLYPFSNFEAVLSKHELKQFETTKGSVHFSAERPLPDALLKRIIQNRAENILAS